MGDYKLRRWFDPSLRRKCEKVDDFPRLEELTSSMLRIMREYGGAGIAAPQVGDGRRVIAARIGTYVQVLVNPKILNAKDHILSIEGCLSLPGLIIPRIRRRSIDLEYQDIEGNMMNRTYKGRNSILLQHEIDHLDGKLMYHYFI